MRNIMAAGFLLFCVGLGGMIGYKLTPDQLGVVVGVVLGVLAGIPFAVLLLVATRNKRAPEPTPLPQPQVQPPIIIVGPTGMPALSQGSADEIWPQVVDRVGLDRDIRVVGEG